MNSNPSEDNSDMNFREAARFWERGRIWYNVLLTLVVVLWVALTWPHFRAAMNLADLGRMIVLGLLANVCYSAAYIVEFFMQAAVAQVFWQRIRWVAWALGMLLALLIENYWIADEIYPGVPEKATLAVGATARGGGIMASNMNFPAPLATLGFLAACGGLFLGLGSALVFWFARKPRFARVAALAIAAGAVVYFGLLIGFSAASRETDLGRGQEKYFCEIDCHLAYSVADVKTQADGSLNDYLVTLRTRFDETTTSAERPKDATLTPSPRELFLIDSSGHEYVPVASAGTSLMTPLKPADSYTTQFEFKVPKDIRGFKLLLSTTPAWPDHVVIGDENSWLHKKTYFAL